MMMVEKQREDGGIGWWKEYEVLRRKFELDIEGGFSGRESGGGGGAGGLEPLHFR